MPSHSSILLIEDSPGECELFRLALTQTGLDVALYTEQNAEAAFHFLKDRSSYHPDWSLQHSPSEAAGEVSTARVERGPSEAARSASTETMPAALPFPPSVTTRCASTGDQSGLPSLILLDLHLHGQNGCDLLKRLRSDARFVAIPVVVFTTSDDPTDLARCYASGANGYVMKPGTFEQLVQCVGDIGRYWIDRNLISYPIGVRC